MIRFCDSDVGCVEYESLNRSELLSYFCSGHLDEIVCVYDGLDAENFVGIMTYQSLLYAVSMDSAIIRERVILDQNVWQNARDIFRKKGRDIRTITPLPVLDKDSQLICFAYQDEDANREIRMLHELRETQGLLHFSDVFPEYRCVKISGFNELAYFFAEYLREQNIKVQVDCMMWQDFFMGEEFQGPEYECMYIYAEGTWDKACNWKENLLRSVSVEFECIDKIYEANIKTNRIGNATLGYEGLLEHLRGGNEVILCGTDMAAQNAYDFLLDSGIEVSGFVADKLNADCEHRLFGKRILGLNEAIHKYKEPVFIDCKSKNSAWGVGQVDYYDYIGYKRNEKFIMLRDYIDVPENNLLNALGSTEVVLTGDRYLCSILYEYLVKNNILVTGYLCMLPTDSQPENMPEIQADSLNQNILCVIVEPVYQSDGKGRVVGKEEKGQRISWLRDRKIDNYTDYFSDMIPFVNIEQDRDNKYLRKGLKPKRVVLGSILSYNGNMFFRSLLDSHPHVLSIYYSDLNSQLFWICLRLSTERSESILPLFWKMIEGNERKIINRSAFVEKMEQLLACGDKFTSQELFVMFHIAYRHMFRKDMTDDDIRNTIIYWEPHFPERDKLEECVRWLGADEVSCDIINIVRNSVSARGAALKYPGYIEKGVKGAYSVIVSYCMLTERKKYAGSTRLVIKFEDLKCNPRETLREICSRWDLEWSDTLMQTTVNGKKDVYDNYIQNISGFDLKPVYNTYDNFFSELDRLRIMLIDAPWRKECGYPYIEPNQFTRRELQEMFLKEFRFENPGDTTGFYKDRLNLEDRIEQQNELRCRIQEARCLCS